MYIESKTALLTDAMNLLCRIVVLFSVLLSSLFANTLTADDNLTAALGGFRMMRQAELMLPEQQKTPVTPAIRLDEAFFAEITHLGADLYIVDKNGNQLPFQLVRAVSGGTILQETAVSGKIVRNQQLPDGRHAVDFELDQETDAISAVELADLELGKKPLISIAAGRAEEFQTLIDLQPLSDISQFTDAPRRRFPLRSGKPVKIIRLILGDCKFSQLATLRVYAADKREHPDSPLQIPYKIRKLGSSSSAADDSFIFAAGNLPLTQLKITSSDPLYLRKAEIFFSNDRRQWQRLSSGTIRRIDLDRADTIDFPETRAKYMLLKIERPEGCAPLKDVAVQAFGSAYEWQLLTTAQNSSVTIYYGNVSYLPGLPSTASPSPRSAEAAAHFFALSEPRDNILRKTGVRDRSTQRHLFGALVTLLALLTVICTFAALKRSQALLPED